jgi:hypothetical protein
MKLLNKPNRLRPHSREVLEVQHPWDPEGVRLRSVVCKFKIYIKKIKKMRFSGTYG